MENVCLHQDVVQMARTPGWGSGGREFESRHPEENEGSECSESSGIPFILKN